MALEATQRRSAWVRLAFCLAAASLLAACIDAAPAWLQDDSAVLVPGTVALEGA